MNTSSLHMILVAAFLFAIVSLAADAQDNAGEPPPSAEIAETTTYTQEQLDQMLAPIALYPDSLLSLILMASTAPLEVVEAERWLQDPNNAALHGDQLATALQDESWAPSVKALVVFPDLIRMMDGNLQWTERLGDAFIGQQADVMNEIQRLRQLAVAAGALQSSSAQTVATHDDIVEIDPANPDVISVPIYNPAGVYGTWPYPDYPPDYLAPDYGGGGLLIDFGPGVFVVSDLFFFQDLDFRHHRIDIDDQRFQFLNGGRPSSRPGVWMFDPAHRHDVPHHAPELRGSGAGQVTVPASQRPFRGFGVEGNGGAAPRPHGEQPVQYECRRPSAPVFESHTNDFSGQAQSVRGRSSRSEMENPGVNRGSGNGANRSSGGGRGHR